MNEDLDVKVFAEKSKKLTSKNDVERRFKVFISHNSKDKAIACQLRDLLVIIPEMDVILDDCSFEIGEPLPEIIVEGIKECGCFVAFLTKNAEKSVWVNQEIGVAIGVDIKIIPMVEEGVCLGLLEGRKYISRGYGEAILDAFSTICDHQTKYENG
ncbi:MAG: toll/interleukin-1 receptor domain-containing protein [Methanosarcinales archaeon]|nr:MAG: toll/interleukin-1 receptor domain-containing protein [Methanosarcinales archaeon]